MRLTYTREALQELSEAVHFYKSCHEGLGREFYLRIEIAEDEILNHPEAWRSLGSPYRRRLLKQLRGGALALLTAAAC